MSLKSYINILFPSLCVSCSKELRYPEKYICLHCSEGWKLNESTVENDNKIEQLFWGKVKIEQAFAVFDFVKGESIQKIIHKFKYRGYKNLAQYMGEIMSIHLQNKFIQTNEKLIIVAVPTIFKNKLKRGYNQAEILAKSFAKNIDLPYTTNILKKQKSVDSQTDKNVLERYENIEKTISIHPKATNLHIEHIILVDDVITTGATLVACASILQKHYNCKISIVTLAFRNL
jgi:ComF family protein